MSTDNQAAVESQSTDAPAEGATTSDLILAKVLHCSETELCSNPGNLELREGEAVVIPTKYGKDMAVILGPVAEENVGAWKQIQPIDRIATETDLARYRQNIRREAQAFDFCRRRIRDRRLDMKLVAAHYILDEPKLLFFFTADGRVDFRELVKDLVGEFRIRIELRQIGVRDESRVLGGVGVCGRTLCCHGLTDKLCPVSIKMAKVQNLSLNSMKISGPCGRLLCCLYYEHGFYLDEKQRFPDEGSRISHDGTMFRITEVNIISRQVRLAGEDGRYLTLPVCRFRRDGDSRRWQILDSEEGCPGAPPTL